MDTEVRVLLVDEDTGVLDITRQFLEDENDDFAVMTATGADEAFDRVERGSFDAVVTDYHMPDTDGLALAETVHDHQPALPVVLFTARRRQEIEPEIDESNVAGHIHKRAGIEQYAELAATIRQAVGV